MRIEVTRKQKAFLDAGAGEVLFGGAAGGGKSYVLLVDAFLYALRYAGSRQLVLRRSFPELEKSLIRVSLGLFPAGVYRYNASKHVGRFANGSLLDFGYCDSENDVYKYQSTEYDTIRFDELTHFTRRMYLYLMSRLRGANAFPKQMKSCTNPGGVGHVWVKERFIEPAEAGTVFVAAGEQADDMGAQRLFIPARVEDNRFLLDADPGYVKRLERLPEKEKRALLYGDWDLFEGQYFPEFSRRIHVVEPFAIPAGWRVYRAMDYGLDMLACYWIAMDEAGQGVVFRELYRKDLIISDAAAEILRCEGGEAAAYMTLAPPDLWNRRQESGRSVADIFGEQGISLTKSGGGRVDGWMAVKEWLKVVRGENGLPTARLRIFAGCRNLIRTLPALQHDTRNANDVAGTPHELTHAPDAIRCFCSYWIEAAQRPEGARGKRWSEDMWEDYNNAGESTRILLQKKWG